MVIGACIVSAATATEVGATGVRRPPWATLFTGTVGANTYTDVEKRTMAYIRGNFRWTDAADEWFRTEIRKWAATK